jgi:hypothetical protein
VCNQDIDDTEQPVEDKNSDTENERCEQLDRRPRKSKEALSINPNQTIAIAAIATRLFSMERRSLTLTSISPENESPLNLEVS